MLILEIKLSHRDDTRRPEYISPPRPLLDKIVEIEHNGPDDVVMVLSRLFEAFGVFNNLVISLLRRGLPK